MQSTCPQCDTPDTIYIRHHGQLVCRECGEG